MISKEKKAAIMKECVWTGIKENGYCHCIPLY